MRLDPLWRGLLLLFGLVGVLAACQTDNTLNPTPAPPTNPTSALIQLPTATPTLLPPTPLPPELAPPPPSPTPIVHIVAQGETLLGIALQYGITVEVLTAANPQVNPRLLSVGTALTIPAADDESLPGLPTATPQPLTPGLVTCYPAPTGVRYCLSEVRNSGSLPLTNIAVQFRLLDGNGVMLTSGSASVPLTVLYPGQASPVSVLFSDPPAGVNAVQAVLLTADDAGGLAANYAPLTASAVQFEISDDAGTQVTATLSHTASGDLSDVLVLVTLYLADGTVRDYRQVTLDAPLPANQPLPLMVSFTSSDSAVIRAEVVAVGRLR